MNLLRILFVRKYIKYLSVNTLNYCVILKGQCHELVCQLRPLLYSLGLNIAPRTCFTPPNRGSLNVKWRVLDSTVLLKSALYFTAELSFVPRSVANVLYHLADFFSIQLFFGEKRLKQTIVMLGGLVRIQF
jgi:hypothetical protein